MIVAAMLGYYVFAIGLLALVGYLAGRKNIRDFTATADRAIAELRRISESDVKRDVALIREHETWLKSLDEVEEPGVTPLAVSPELSRGGQTGGVNRSTQTGEKVRALVLTFRVVPGASEDVLAGMTAHLLCGLSHREEELGGEGLELDVKGVERVSDRVTLILFPSKHEGAAERVAVLADELNAESRRMKGSAMENDGLGAKIERNLKSQLPESALKQLELAAVA